ncbi:hypothetical protein H9Q13_04155 [Pontibacter sp. JH31]|uniref:STAS/SEC14 domain-containing protein n=1 Tax=Pontibacter aquaedesilientis TaxID=2766980 RepID=A0ABR7XDH6_9BACT|nr:hypothetical protein [Pontibacter aquaedesilientis]MBD1396347.1 hypothetical protein [Pontibacter aquaedesilientis]
MIDHNSHTEEMPEFCNDYLYLIVDERAHLMYSMWTRSPDRQEYREAAEIFIGFLRENHIRYWIQNTNHLGEVPLEEMKAAMQQFMPLAPTTLRKLARICSDEQSVATFMKLASQTIEQLSPNIEIQSFMTYREAVDWISSDRQ